MRFNTEKTNFTYRWLFINVVTNALSLKDIGFVGETINDSFRRWKLYIRCSKIHVLL